MRVTSHVERLVLVPGTLGHVPLTFFNTSSVIDQISVSVLGLEPETIRTEPAVLSLFPDEGGEMVTTIELPLKHPAGTYLVTLVGTGVVPGGPVVRHHIELVIPEAPALSMSAAPTVVRGHRQGEFTVDVRNDGNVSVEAALRVHDDGGTLSHELVPSTVTVPVGGTASSTIVVRAPRRWLGTDFDRPFTTVATAPAANAQISLVLRQRPLIGRGMMTILILLAILLLWALAFLLGVRQVLGVDPFAKQAPASFFAGQSTDGTDSGTAPDGAMPKEGTVPAAVGSSITGKVTGELDQQGVGRVRVEILRRGRDGMVSVASTASQTDGTYTVSGLLPANYYVRVDQAGYDPLWFPTASSRSGAKAVKTLAQASRGDVDLQVTGDPATLSGTVKVANVADARGVTVTATPTWPGAEDEPALIKTAAVDGSYSFEDLPAPGSYELSFEADGVQPTVITERVLGGQERFALDVVLRAQPGSITGKITDGTGGVGGATVTTTVDGKAVEVGTPSVGQIGSFVLPNLPTPGTYVLTVSKPGFASRTSVVALTAGEQRTGLDIPLVGGAGQLTGKITSSSGTALGGVKVTIDGGGSSASTTSLTGSGAGTYVISGLTAPGQFTATFTLEGYRTVSVPVTLTADKPSAVENVKMESDRATLKGRVVTAGGTGVNGVTIRVTNGMAIRETVSASGSAGNGSWSLTGLPAGDYTITAVRRGVVEATQVVEVTAGQTLNRTLRLGGS